MAPDLFYTELNCKCKKYSAAKKTAFATCTHSIRHYGILSSTAKTKAIDLIRKQLPVKKTKTTKVRAIVYNPLLCKCCKKETMICILNFDQRGPPTKWKYIGKVLLQQIKLN